MKKPKCLKCDNTKELKSFTLTGITNHLCPECYDKTTFYLPDQKVICKGKYINSILRMTNK